MRKLKRPLQALLIASDEKVWESIFGGQKKITIRDGHRNYQEGFCILCDIDLGISIGVDITKVRHCSYGTITPREYKAEGYSSKKNMLKDMKKLYPDADYSEDATVIEWNDARGKFIDEYKRSKDIAEVLKEIEKKSQGTGMEIKF